MWDGLTSWADRHAFVREQAERQLVRGAVPRPLLLAFAGPTPRLLAVVRPFGPDEPVRALGELVAAALPLGADRLLAALPGTSRTPGPAVPPPGPAVPPPGQRQRLVHGAEAVAGPGPVSCRSWLWPYTVQAGRTDWGRSRVAEHAQGPVATVAAALGVWVARRAELRADDGDVRDQLARCLELGHDLYLPVPVARRLQLSAPGVRSGARGAACRRGRRAGPAP